MTTFIIPWNLRNIYWEKGSTSPISFNFHPTSHTNSPPFLIIHNINFFLAYSQVSHVSKSIRFKLSTFKVSQSPRRRKKLILYYYFLQLFYFIDDQYPCFLLWLFSFNMVLKVPHVICFILWLSLLVLLFQEFKFLKTNNKVIISNDHHHHHSLFGQRKALIASNFDFTPFMKNVHHHHHHYHHQDDVYEQREEPAGGEIDQRYGVEKRLVPTGPNPLHH